MEKEDGGDQYAEPIILQDDKNRADSERSSSNSSSSSSMQEHLLDDKKKGFFMAFCTSTGPPQITVLLILLAFSFGSTVGVVPAIMSDRFARLNHGHGNDDDQQLCSLYDPEDKPQACYAGSSDAQNALATEMFLAHGLTFFTCSLVGALSDEHGRRGILIFGIVLSGMNPITLLLIQLQPNMSPWWYYGISALQGLVSWSTVALSSLTDAVPAQWRAPSFGLAIAGLSFGFALAPHSVLALGHFGVAILSLVMVCLAFVFAVLFLPETLTPEAAARAKVERQQQELSMTMKQSSSGNGYGSILYNNKWLWYLYRPLWELSILNRDDLFRLLALLAFLCGIVSSGDKALILYYIQDRLGFTDKDIAHLFLLIGVLMIISQGCLLKILNDAIGERGVVMLGFSLGTIHNALYGLAEQKSTIFIAAAIATIVAMVHPTLSAILSNNVQESEYGRIQGALASLQSLAAAFGPMSLRFVYHFTKDGAFMGPGSMFIFASGLYATSAVCSYFLPPSRVNSNHCHEQQQQQPRHPEEMQVEEGPEFVIAGTQLI